MKRIKASLPHALWLAGVFLMTSCSATETRPEIILVGSTPGDEPIKSMLSISANIKVDFIKWNLKLSNKDAFDLDIIYGESQPNTLGFKGDGYRQTMKGTYSIERNLENSRFKEVYHLKRDDLSERISLVKLNENLFHILTYQNQLMVGNGGWSYSLSRQSAVDPGKILISSLVSEDKSLQLVFDGRTPCQEIAAEHPEMNASPSCFKLKWRLILNRDSVTHLPATCTIRKVVDNQPRDISGKWTIIKEAIKDSDAIIYKIELNESDAPISLLVGDENVLFFLDRNNQPFTGNEDFSFVLNRRM